MTVTPPAAHDVSPARAGDTRVRVMQVVDTLDTGGAERVAVNLANLLPRDQFESYLCTTRRGGPLEAYLAPHVSRVALNRKGRFDGGAIRRLIAYVNQHRIRVLHAHGSSLFVARLTAFAARLPVVVWHDHYGRCDLGDRSSWMYHMATRGAGVIAVNDSLAEWSRTTLGVPAHRVWYVPNWVEIPQAAAVTGPLPGSPGRRIVCVANFREQKDHLNLLRAVAKVRQAVPDVQVLLVGSPTEPACAERVRLEIDALQLAENVACLGARQDVGAILQASDIGVLSSVSEGLPLALLEYGMAGLPVVATDVGQCREVLDDGGAGLLVPASSPEPLAAALVQLLQSAEQRATLGAALRAHVLSRHDPQIILGQIGRIYQSLLRGKAA